MSWVGLGGRKPPGLPPYIFQMLSPSALPRGNLQIGSSLSFELLGKPDSQGLGQGRWEMLLGCQQPLQSGKKDTSLAINWRMPGEDSCISTVWGSQPLTVGNPILKDLSAKNVLPEGVGTEGPEVIRDNAAGQESQKVMWLSKKEQEGGECPSCVYYFSPARMFFYVETHPLSHQPCRVDAGTKA